MRLGKIHAARLENSERLQRVLRVLRHADGWVSTWEIVHRARVCAVNTAIAELRWNGIEVECQRGRDGNYYYRLPRRGESPRERKEPAMYVQEALL